MNNLSIKLSIFLLGLTQVASKVTIIASKMPNVFFTHSITVDLTPMVDLSEADPKSLKFSSTDGLIKFSFRKSVSVLKVDIPSDIRVSSIDDFSGAYFRSRDSITSQCFSGILASQIPVTLPPILMSEKSCYNSIGNKVAGGIDHYFTVYYDFEKLKLIVKYNDQTRVITGTSLSSGTGLDVITRGRHDTHGYFVMQGFIYRVADNFKGEYKGNSILKFDVESNGEINSVEESFFEQEEQDQLKIKWVNCAFRDEDSSMVLYCWLRVSNKTGNEKFRFVKRAEKNGIGNYQKLFEIEIKDGVVGVDKFPETGWSTYTEFNFGSQTLKICNISDPKFDPSSYESFTKDCFIKNIDIVFGSSRYVKYLKVDKEYALLEMADKTDFTYQKSYGFSMKRSIDFPTLPIATGGYFIDEFRGVSAVNSSGFGNFNIFRLKPFLSFYLSQPKTEKKFSIELTFEDSDGKVYGTLETGFKTYYNSFDVKPRFENELKVDILNGTGITQDYYHKPLICEGDYFKMASLFQNVVPSILFYKDIFGGDIVADQKLKPKNNRENFKQSSELKIKKWNTSLAINSNSAMLLSHLSIVQHLPERNQNTLEVLIDLSGLKINFNNSRPSTNGQLFFIQSLTENVGHILRFDNKSGEGDYRIRKLVNVDTRAMLDMNNEFLTINEDTIDFKAYGVVEGEKVLRYVKRITMNECYISLQTERSFKRKVGYQDNLQLNLSTALSSREIILNYSVIENPNTFIREPIYRTYFGSGYSLRQFNMSYYYHFLDNNTGIDVDYQLTDDKDLQKFMFIKADWEIYKFKNLPSNITKIKQTDLKYQGILSKSSADEAEITIYEKYKLKDKGKFDFNVKNFDFKINEKKEICFVGLYTDSENLIWHKTSNGKVNNISVSLIKEVRLISNDEENKAIIFILTQDMVLKALKFECGAQNQGKIQEMKIFENVTHFDYSYFEDLQKKKRVLLLITNNTDINILGLDYSSFNIFQGNFISNETESVNLKIFSGYLKLQKLGKNSSQNYEIVYDCSDYKLCNLKFELVPKKMGFILKYLSYYIYKKPVIMYDYECQITKDFIICFTPSHILKKYETYPKELVKTVLVWPKKEGKFEGNGYVYRISKLTNNIGVSGASFLDSYEDNQVSLLSKNSQISTTQFQYRISMLNYLNKLTENFTIQDFNFTFRGNYWSDSEVLFEGGKLMRYENTHLEAYKSLKKIISIFSWTLVSFVILWNIVGYCRVKQLEKKGKKKKRPRTLVDSIIEIPDEEEEKTEDQDEYEKALLDFSQLKSTSKDIGGSEFDSRGVY